MMYIYIKELGSNNIYSWCESEGSKLITFAVPVLSSRGDIL